MIAPYWLFIGALLHASAPESAGLFHLRRSGKQLMLVNY
jgi:hypothetical protein